MTKYKDKDLKIKELLKRVRELEVCLDNACGEINRLNSTTPAEQVENFLFGGVQS